MPDLFSRRAASFQPTGQISDRVMSQAQCKAKLRMISRLEAGELNGWLKARTYDRRPWFPGEMEALRERADQLGVSL